MKRLLLLAGLIAAVAAPAAAHHSFAMFDATKTQTFKGRVKELQWNNPHIWLQLMVEQPNGRMVEWAFEGQNIATARRGGWTDSVVKPGDVVTVVAHPARSGAARASIRSVTLADGRALSGHTSGSGLGPGPSFTIEGAR